MYVIQTGHAPPRPWGRQTVVHQGPKPTTPWQLRCTSIWKHVGLLHAEPASLTWTRLMIPCQPKPDRSMVRTVPALPHDWYSSEQKMGCQSKKRSSEQKSGRHTWRRCDSPPHTSDESNPGATPRGHSALRAHLLAAAGD